MEERNARDEAITVGAEALAEAWGNPKAGHYGEPDDAALVLDAAHKAGLITFADEWRVAEWDEAEAFCSDVNGREDVFVRRLVEEGDAGG